MAKKNETGEAENKEANKLLTILIALFIVIIWLSIFAVLVKLDVGGFGSGVLRPILKDVPIVNQVLPSVGDEQIAVENDYAYTSLPQAIAKIRELEHVIAQMTENSIENSKSKAELQAEIDRLKVFEENQLSFEERVLEFDKKVVFADAAPKIEEYKKFYEGINPANAELIYRQVIEQLQYSNAIKEKANIYKSMEPKNAAKILQTMTADIESVAQILLSMKPKESAVILAEMDNVIAAKITKKMLDMDEEKLKK